MDQELYAHAERRCFGWAPELHYSQAVVTNAPLVLAAGQGPFGEDGSVVGAGDPEAQIRRTFDNLATVLERVGASLDTVVSQTVYLARPEDFATFKRVRAEVFSPPFPAATTLRADLLEPEMLVEITAIAAVGVARSDRESS
jgi:2-iminobutanoate/2-iminopropanoate deaminase